MEPGNIIDEKIFDTPWYGWCDIGYFRNNNGIVKNWPNNDKRIHLPLCNGSQIVLLLYVKSSVLTTHQWYDVVL